MLFLLAQQTQNSTGNLISTLITYVILVVITYLLLRAAENNGSVQIVEGQSNKVIKVSFVAGIVGIFVGNALVELNNSVRQENLNGWEVVQILPDTNTNLFTIILRIIMLLLTFFLYTTSNGYLVVLKRK